MSSILLLAGSGRPATVPQSPFICEPNDGGGNVYCTPPPEWPRPTAPDPLFFIGDFGNLTLPGNYRFGGPGTSCTLIDGPYAGLVIPWKAGANSTPPTRLMSPMVVMYPPDVQAAYFTEAGKRGYTHFTTAPDGWNFDANGFDISIPVQLDWARQVKARGFFNNFWRGKITTPDPAFEAHVKAGLVDFYTFAKEIDGQVPGAAMPPILDYVTSFGVPAGAHFTAGPHNATYPLTFPLDTYINDWSRWNGKLHLCEQFNSPSPGNPGDSAGTMGALFYYARKLVNLGIGGDGSVQGPGAPDSRVIAYEVGAMAGLFGIWDETTGVRRCWEINCCPNGGDPRIRGVSGSNNGLWMPNGQVVLPA